MRVGFWFCGVLLLSGLVATLVHAQISEADKKKRDAFVKAREEMRTVGSPTPAVSPSPSGKPKPAKKKGKAGKSPTPKPSAADKEEAQDEDDASPSATAGKGRSPSPKPSTPKRKVEPSESPDVEPASPARPAATPASTATPLRSIPVPTQPPAPTAAITTPPADITIEKSGLEQGQGYEPPPPPQRRGFWFFGRRERYRYLSNSVIEQIRRAPVQRARWKFIIVHNSGTRQGNARAFDFYHKRVRRMKNGMAYHFVVGNGTSSGNGAIEIGDRWRRQFNGGHVHSDYLNNISLGICLVGDFNRDRPTKAQMEATEELIKYLRDRCGKVDGRAIGVRPHREMNPPRWATDCPGDAFPYGWFRRF